MRNILLLGFFCFVFSLGHSQSYLGWVTTNVNFREGPGTAHNVINSLEAGNQIFIISLSPKNGFINIIDISSNKEGYVSKAYVKVGEKVNSSSGLFQPTGETSSYSPNIEIYNNTSRNLTLKMNNHKFSFTAHERKTINVPPGHYDYRASAPGVIPNIGKERIENNMGYSWEFYISTR